MNPFSKLGTIKLSDWWRGLIVACITTPLTIIYQSATAGTLIFDWKAIVGAFLAGGTAYLLKNLATGQGGRLLTDAKPEPPKGNP